MALTLVSRETFQTVGTLNSGSPGNLGTVTGSFYKRAGGPLVAGDTTASGYGWSADLQTAVAHHTMVTTASSTTAADMFCAWFYFKGAPSANGLTILKANYNSNQNTNLQIQLDTSLVATVTGLGTVVNSAAPLTLTPNTWYWFAIARVKNGLNNADFRAYYATIGGSATLLASSTNSNNGYYAPCNWQGGCITGGTTVNMRYGAPS